MIAYRACSEVLLTWEYEWLFVPVDGELHTAHLIAIVKWAYTMFWIA